MRRNSIYFEKISYVIVIAVLCTVPLLSPVTLSLFSSSPVFADTRDPRVFTDSDRILDEEDIRRIEERLDRFLEKNLIDLAFYVTEDLQTTFGGDSVSGLIDAAAEVLELGKTTGGTALIVGSDETLNKYSFLLLGDTHRYFSEDAVRFILNSILLSYDAAGRTADGIIHTVDLLEASVSSTDDEVKLFDFADLLTDEAEARIREKAAAFKRKHQMDLVFLFGDEFSYDTSFAEFVLDVFHYMNFGYGGKPNGVMFGLDMAARKHESYMTGTAEMKIPFQLLLDHSDAYVPYLSSGDYERALEGYIHLLDLVASGEIEELEREIEAGENTKTFGFGILISVVAAALITVITAMSQKMVVKKTNATEYMIPGSAKLTDQEDVYTHTTVTRTKIKSESSGGGSGGSVSGSSGGSGSHAGGSF